MSDITLQDTNQSGKQVCDTFNNQPFRSLRFIRFGNENTPVVCITTDKVAPIQDI